MRVLKSGNWAMDWSYYNGRAATTYYRKGEVVRALRHYGHSGEESPNQEINPYTDAGFLVTHNVTPYRIVYHD
jgi:hypothetical protein